VPISSQPSSFGRRGVPAVKPTNARTSTPRVAETAFVSAAMIVAFVGRNKHKYEPTIEAMERSADDFSKWTIGWSWAALFVPVLWLAYRKMWAHAAVVYFAMIAIGYLAGNQAWLSSAAYIVFALFAKSVYVSHAAGRIRRILASESNAAASAIAIRDAGGVSVGGAWIAFFLMLLPGVALVAAAVAAAQI